jgi:hypothetical protein
MKLEIAHAVGNKDEEMKRMRLLMVTMYELQ